MAAQGDFAHMRQHLIDPIHHDDEVIRPIVLFVETAAERSRQTGMERTGVGDKARRLVLVGMGGLRDRRTEARGSQAPGSPDAMAGYILSWKQLYPPSHWRAPPSSLPPSSSSRAGCLSPATRPVRALRADPSTGWARWSVEKAV